MASVAGIPAAPAPLEKKPVKFSNLLCECFGFWGDGLSELNEWALIGVFSGCGIEHVRVSISTTGQVCGGRVGS